MKSKKFIIFLIFLLLFSVACNSKVENSPKEKVLSEEETAKTEVSNSKVEIETEPDDEFSKSLDILLSNDLVKSLEYDGAKYIDSFDENIELNGKSLTRIDFIEDHPTHIHTAYRYAVDNNSKEIYIMDYLSGEWVLIEDYFIEDHFEGDLGLIFDYKKVKLANPILEVGTDFYISVVDLANAFDLKLEYEENIYDESYNDVKMIDSNGRFIFAAGNVVYSSDGIYYINLEVHQPIIYKGENIYLNSRDISQAMHLHLRFNADENAVEFMTNDEKDVYPVYYNLYDEYDQTYEIKASFDIVWEDGNYIMSNEKMQLSEYVSNLIENYDIEDPIYQTDEGILGIYDFYMSYKGDRIDGFEMP